MSHYIKIMKDDELTHFGVLGMKWGKRKTSYSSTELSDRQKKRASKAYAKEMGKTSKSISGSDLEYRLKAYNKTADEWNTKRLTNYNKRNNPDSQDYDSKMEKAFTQDTMYNLTKMRVSHIEKNENYQKAQKLVKKYDMLKYDEMVKNDTKGHNQIVDYINNYKPEYED